MASSEVNVKFERVKVEVETLRLDRENVHHLLNDAEAHLVLIEEEAEKEYKILELKMKNITEKNALLEQEKSEAMIELQEKLAYEEETVQNLNEELFDQMDNHKLALQELEREHMLQCKGNADKYEAQILELVQIKNEIQECD